VEREQAIKVFEAFEAERVSCTLTYRHIPNFSPAETWAVAVQVAFHASTHEYLRKIMDIAEAHDCEMQLSHEAGMANIVEKQEGPGGGGLVQRIQGKDSSSERRGNLRVAGDKR